jgi:putative acetyltransferase
MDARIRAGLDSDASAGAPPSCGNSCGYQTFGAMANPGTQVSIESVDPLGEEAGQLLRELRAEAQRRYDDLLNSPGAPPTNEPVVSWSAYLIARLGGQPVGCAALAPLDEATAEVRRVYVMASVRRQGIARLLIAGLERRVAELGYRTLRLATGIRQLEAIALYETFGFRRIPPFGVHIGDPVNICFEKQVGGGGGRAA